MSSRRPANVAAPDHATQIRTDIEDLKQRAAAFENAAVGAVYVEEEAVVSANADDASSTLVFEDLSPVEQACASLGAPADGLRPISWLNEAHYEALVSSNSLDSDLTRRLEAYKVVASR